MREIKFRAWDKTYNIMQNPDDFVDEFITSKGEVVEVTEWSDYGGGGCNIDSIDHHRILMQYTGLKDRDNKEIYEGDICTIWMGCKQNKPYVVTDMRELYSDVNNSDSYLRITQIEVIGNIHENPELLEGVPCE